MHLYILLSALAVGLLVGAALGIYWSERPSRYIDIVFETDHRKAAGWVGGRFWDEEASPPWGSDN